jgi:hypothetical protein
MFSSRKSSAPAAAAAAADPQFNYVTALLHGDGTNGAQNNTFLDSSTNAFTITRNGTPTQGSFSPYGSLWSNYFGTTTSDGLTFPSIALGTNSFTLECWFFPTASSYPSFTYLIAIAVSGGDYVEVGFNGTTNQIVFGGGGGGLGITSIVGTYTPNQWNHVAAVRNGTTCTLYVNGVSQGTATTPYSVTTAPVIVGGLSWASGYAFKGYISNARVVNGTAVYTSNFTPSTTPLTAITNTAVLTCQSNRFLDASTNNYSVTITGTPQAQRFNPFLPTSSQAYSTSVYGGSGYFVEANSCYLTAPTSSVSLSGNFTVEFWFYYLNGSTNGPALFTIGDSKLSSGLELQYAYSTQKFQLTQANVTTLSSTYTNGAILYQWHHVAIVRSGTTITLYVDGVSYLTLTNSNTISGTTYTGCEFYNSALTNYWNGYISDFRIVNGTAVYTSTFTPPTAPLTAITNTSLLESMTNAGIYDNAMIPDWNTFGSAQISTSIVKYGTGSIKFNGAGGDYLYTTATAQFNPNKPYTIEFWTYPLTSVNQVSFISSSSGYFYLETYSGSLFLGDGVNNIISVSPPSLNAWTHVAVSYDGTTSRLFFNGVSQGTSTTALQSQTLSTWYVGQRYDGTRPFNGYIDDLRITKGYARYTANFTPPTAALPNYGR